MTNENPKPEVRQVPNPLNLSARFLAARPDLVGAWIIGAHSLLPIFKTEYKTAIITFLETVEHEFFAALTAQIRKQVPGLDWDKYYLGTVVRNKKTGKERMVIGITPADPKDQYSENIYHYINDRGKIGSCAAVTLREWQWK